uniref:Uncharacterized protein n=1 Tax=Oryza meridionalis TaxID=40149 RepID=A0A0E0E1L6_9ORYZ
MRWCCWWERGRRCGASLGHAAWERDHLRAAALEGRAAQEAEDVLVGIRCGGRASVAVAAAGGGGGA